jgi:hypothetical protein
VKKTSIRKNKCQGTLVQPVAGAGDAPAGRRPSYVPNKVETTKSFVVGRVSTRTAGVRTNERRETFVRAAAGADVAPACHRPWPALNTVETTKKLVVGPVSERGNGADKDKRQEMFARTVAGASGAPACCGVLKTLRNVEETCSSTKEISKRLAALATLPPEVRVNHLPGSRSQTSSRTCRYPPPRSSSPPIPIDDLVIGRGKAMMAGVERKGRPETFVRAVASAENAPARYRSPPTRKPVTRWVCARGTDVGMNKRQRTFVRAVAGAEYAPAGPHPSLALDNVETMKKLVVG